MVYLNNLGRSISRMNRLRYNIQRVIAVSVLLLAIFLFAIFLFSFPKKNGNSLPSSDELSLIVPATYKDFLCFGERFLERMYTEVADPPSELIIVVSGVPLFVPLTYARPPIRLNMKVQVVHFYSPHNQAQNRNIGAHISTGNLLTFFDMDDLPHPRRFQIIRFLFRRYSYINGAVFGYAKGDHNESLQYTFENYDNENLPFHYDIRSLENAYAARLEESPQDAVLRYWCCEPVGKDLHNGWGTYRRNKFMTYMYNESSSLYRAEDTDLNMRLILDHQNFTFWDIILGFYETKDGRNSLEEL
jgi:hypothetical protein